MAYTLLRFSVILRHLRPSPPFSPLFLIHGCYALIPFCALKRVAPLPVVPQTTKPPPPPTTRPERRTRAEARVDHVRRHNAEVEALAGKILAAERARGAGAGAGASVFGAHRIPRKPAAVLSLSDAEAEGEVVRAGVLMEWKAPARAVYVRPPGLEGSTSTSTSGSGDGDGREGRGRGRGRAALRVPHIAVARPIYEAGAGAHVGRVGRWGGVLARASGAGGSVEGDGGEGEGLGLHVLFGARVERRTIEHARGGAALAALVLVLLPLAARDAELPAIAGRAARVRAGASPAELARAAVAVVPRAALAVYALLAVTLNARAAVAGPALPAPALALTLALDAVIPVARALRLRLHALLPRAPAPARAAHPRRRHLPGPPRPRAPGSETAGTGAVAVVERAAAGLGGRRRGHGRAVGRGACYGVAAALRRACVHKASVGRVVHGSMGEGEGETEAEAEGETV
ncbi:hypothetical protein DFH09DRAFT_1507686 [Mycena vulgaris]|nr:hypothetical protein DFH09DRAFT_1507686 [Mycena vulgaris]